MNPFPPDVLLITVNYRRADSTAQFLESASALEGFRAVHVLVVENGSADGSAEKLRPIVARFGNVELLESSVNLGYFGGANWALQQYLAKAPQPDWVIVCNNDILFDQRDLMLRLLDRDPRTVGVVAPAIVASGTGADCNPFLYERPSAWQVLRYRFWISNYYCAALQQLLSPYVRILRHQLNSWLRKPPSGQYGPVYAAHGSFLIFSRAYFESGGYIDDGFFLYAEEFTVAEICLRLGLTVSYDPSLRVSHDAHQATGRWPNRAICKHAKQGLNYAFQKYFLQGNASQPAPFRRG